MRNRTIVAIALALAAALLLAGIVAAAPAPGKPALITSAGQSTCLLYTSPSPRD